MAWNRWRLFCAASLILPSCATPTLKTQLINAERRATEAEKHLDEAEQEMAALEPDAAERALKQAQQSMSDPDVGYYPEREMIFQRMAADLKKLPEVRKKREARDLAIEVDARRVEVDKALAEFKPALEALKSRELLRADVDRATEAAGGLKDALDGGSKLEKKDEAYAAYSRNLRMLLDQSRSQIDLGKKRLEFIAGPGKARREALELILLAKGERNREKRVGLHGQALEKFTNCAKDGERMLAEFPPLAKAVTVVGVESLTPQSAVIGCIKRAHALKQAAARTLRASHRTRR